MLAALLMPWRGGESALASPGLLDVILLLVALAGTLLPLVVASSPRTNVPIVFETVLWTFSLLVGVVLLVKVAFPPEGGLEAGFWLALAGMLAMGLVLWRSVARER